MRRILLAVGLLLALTAPGDARLWPHRGTGVVTSFTVIPATLTLDATAHPAGAAISANHNTGGGAWNTIITPSFSTAGAAEFVLGVYADGSAVPFGSETVANTSGLTWTRQRNDITVAQDGGTQIWTAYSSTSLSSQTVTFATNKATSTAQKGIIDLKCIAGIVGVTDAANVGNTAGQFNTGTGTVQQAITPTYTGSWLVVMLGQTNDLTTLTANSSTTPYDSSLLFATSDYAASGRYKSGGSVSTTTGGSAVTVGSSVSDSFWPISVVEIKAVP